MLLSWKGAGGLLLLQWLTRKFENVQPEFVVLLLNVIKILTKPSKFHWKVLLTWPTVLCWARLMVNFYLPVQCKGKIAFPVVCQGASELQLTTLLSG